MITISQEAFLKLPSEEISNLVRSSKPQVCVFPINGTRRWFMMEYLPGVNQDVTSIYNLYRDKGAQEYINIFRLMFEHGIETLLAPQFGAEMTSRGNEYTNVAIEALEDLATNPIFLEFYNTHQVRVRFYGDYRKFLAGTPYSYLSEIFDNLTQSTLSHDKYRLFFGVCANDPTETVAELTVEYYAKYGRAPDRSTIVEIYYGEYVEKVDLFIGFDKFSAFDMPLLALGEEDLYFMVAPSLYLTQNQLREILYDHLYTRRVEESNNWEIMKDFYQSNLGKTLGVGNERDGFWYPLPQVKLPPGF